jgi:hypothetical protein
MLSRGHGNHVLGDGICIEPVFFHALNEPQPSHNVKSIRCGNIVSVCSQGCWLWLGLQANLVPTVLVSILQIAAEIVL